MPKLSLSKSDLQKQKQQLKLYLKLLPSLDLKRTQLIAEYTRTISQQELLAKEGEKGIVEVGKLMPMLANRDVKLDGLVKIDSFKVGEESVVGVKVPYLQELTFSVREYSFLATPVWMEGYIQLLKKGVEERVRREIFDKRVECLKRAVRRITQHVNLFEKVLIPTAKANIQKIQILLGEAERSAVIRSKIAKALHAKQRVSEFLVETSP